MLAQGSLAAGLITRTQSLDGNLLPKGLWMIGYDQGASGAVNSQYSNSGQSQSLVEALRKDLKVKDITKTLKPGLDLGLAKAAFEAYGLSAEDSAGTVVNNLDISYQSETFIFGRGVTDNLSLFFIAPKIRMDVRLNSEVQYSEKVKAMINSLKNQGQHSRAEEIEIKSKNILKEQLQDYGYEDALVSSWEGVPNWVLSARYQTDYLKSKNISFETQLILPNEEDVYQDQFIPVELMEEAPSLIQAAYLGLYQSQRLRWNAFAHYQVRTRFKKQVRVPEVGEDFAQDKEMLKVRYGNEWHIGTQVGFKPNKSFNVFTNLRFQNKDQDSYAGNQYQRARYAELEEDTDQQQLLAGVGLQMDLVDRFLRNKFPIPLIMTAQYSRSLEGVNSFDNDFYSLNALVFVQ